jgi:hypothetical protein
VTIPPLPASATLLAHDPLAPDGILPVVSTLAIRAVHAWPAGLNVMTLNVKLLPLAVGAWGSSAHALTPPSLIPSAFAPIVAGTGPGLLGLAEVAFTEVVPAPIPLISTLQRVDVELAELPRRSV